MEVTTAGSSSGVDGTGWVVTIEGASVVLRVSNQLPPTPRRSAAIAAMPKANHIVECGVILRTSVLASADAL
jgi:hypothetical protein